jgi:4-hydroxyphenylpyruvate dioxygenase
VAFDVDNVELIYKQAVKKGAVSISAPEVVGDDFGSATVATICTYGDTTHTLVNRSSYGGAFLPGYRAENTHDPIASYLPGINIETIDHCVGNMDWNGMESTCQ